jgi:hypothetical protein
MQIGDTIHKIVSKDGQSRPLYRRITEDSVEAPQVA